MLLSLLLGCFGERGFKFEYEVLLNMTANYIILITQIVLLCCAVSGVSGWSSILSSSRPFSIPKSIQQQQLQKTMRTSSSILAALTVAVPLSARAATSEKDFISALSVIYTSKAILKPIGDYVKNMAYDNARTNVKYLLNQLQIEKAATQLIKASLDFAENSDAIEEAQEVGSSIGNALIQLDSTIYTVIFIPSDDSGGVPPAAEKYLKQLQDYLLNVNRSLDILLSLGGEAQLVDAKKLSEAQLKSLPDTKVLFKDVLKKSTI